MTMPSLPAAGNTNWRDTWAQAVHDAATEVVTGRLASTNLAAYIRTTMATGVVNVKDYGALGNGVADDRAAIQSAIDAANTLYTSTGQIITLLLPAGVYLVGSVNYVRDDASLLGATSLKMRDGVHLTGTGTIKVKNSAYGSGAFYRCFSSRDGATTMLRHASITDITIDGNKANQPASTQCSNIVLECLDDVRVENVRSINANGNGIMLRGRPDTLGTDLKIVGNTVRDCSYIGIQSSQFDGLVISNNFVADTVDNCIDIYGDDGTTTTHGRNFTISNNTVRRGLVGIFPETVRDGTVSGNVIDDCTAGMQVNRINGEPRAIVITGNSIRDCDTAMSVYGDTGGVLISGNTFDGFTTTGVALGGAGGNVSRVVVDGNFFQPATSTLPLVTVDGAQASFLRVAGNYSSGYAPATEYSRTATVEVANLLLPFRAMSGTEEVVVAKGDLSIASGGSTTITLPGWGAGTLTIYATSGGSWDSVWQGVFACGPSRVTVSQTATTFTTPGNAIASVTGSTTTTVVTITTTATGSGVGMRWVYRFI